MIRRRRVLQLSSLSLVALSLPGCINNLSLQLQRKRLRKTSKFRQLALLIGINDYSIGSQIPSLRGCLTDVELQKNLLIHRYGFLPADIVTLINAQATRTNILDTFEHHLIQQANTGDIVVFHYSGHGSQIADPDRDFTDGLVSTLVPVDSRRGADQGPVLDITGHTLFLLMSALKTENVTVILDCCYSGGGKRGNCQARAITGGLQYQASPEEIAYQQRWLSRLGLAREEFKQRRRQGVAKGVVITATNRDQLAADMVFDGFTAGTFTYLMTQSLWQQERTLPVEFWLPAIVRLTQQISFTRQRPELETKPGSQNQKQPIYFIDQSLPPAEAVITKIKGSWTEFWLGGVDALSLAAFDQGARFAIIDRDGQPQGQVQMESRQGLVGQGRLSSPGTFNWQPGNLLQEQVRGIPSDLALKVGLDTSLDGEITAAQKALQLYKQVRPVRLQQEEVHCILGRITQQPDQSADKNLSNRLLPGSLGLFTPGLEMIPNSFGAPGEKVEHAVRRLGSKFKSLLAVRLIRLLLNPNSSQLQVAAYLKLSNSQEQILASTTSLRGLKQSQPQKSNSLISQMARLPLERIVQLIVVNSETQALYVSVLTIDANQDITLLFPYGWKATEIASRIEAGQTITIPDPTDNLFELRTQEPKGVTEILIIASSKPLQNTLKGLQTIALKRGHNSQPIAIDDPLEVMFSLLFDLGDTSITRGNAQIMHQPDRDSLTIADSKNLSIDITQVAVMSLNIEIV